MKNVTRKIEAVEVELHTNNVSVGTPVEVVDTAEDVADVVSGETAPVYAVLPVEEVERTLGCVPVVNQDIYVKVVDDDVVVKGVVVGVIPVDTDATVNVVVQDSVVVNGVEGDLLCQVSNPPTV